MLLLISLASIATAIITLIIVGVCLFLLETYIPVSAPIKTVLRVVIVLLLCLWLLDFFGVMKIPIH